MTIHKDIMRLLFAAGWMAFEQQEEEISIKLCRQAAIALGLITSAEQVILQDRWEDNTHPPVKRSKEVLQLLSNANGSLDQFLASLDCTEVPSKMDGLLSAMEAMDDKCSPGEKQHIPPLEKESPAIACHEDNVNMLSILQNIANVRHVLAEIVIGQDDAIEAVCDGLSRQLYSSNENAPAAVFLFIGSMATGKTLLATTLAKALGGDWESISVQMENMTSDNEGFAINGVTRGYGTAEPGKVTGFVRKHPRSVVVFENFDKAHPNVRSAIKSLFTTGVIVDQCGFYEKDSEGGYNFSKQIAEPEVSFHESIVIFTTNAGEEVYDSPVFEKMTSTRPEQLESIILNELSRLDGGNLRDTRNTISTSFLAGLASGSTVLFRKMTLESMSICARNSIERALDRLRTGLGRTIGRESIDMLSKALLLSFSPNVSALTANSDLLERLFDPLMDHIRDRQDAKMPAHIRIRFATGQLAELKRILASFEGIDPVAQMFRKSQTLHISIRAYTDDDVLYVEMGDLALQRVPHAHDFRGAGAVRAEVPDVGFEKIAGHHAVKKRMVEIVKLLKKPASIKRMGVGVPKGLLLWGPPGTGKTMLAKALAHEADLPFISTTGSELLDVAFVKTIFKRARKYAPSILFVDEIDVIGSRGNHSYRDIVINQLLTEIDGFDTGLSAPVFIVAATNLPEQIDNALTRSGRIDLKVEVPALDQEARMHFIEAYFKLPNDGTLDRKLLLNHTAGMNGADLQMVKRETVLAMVSSGRETVSMDMLTEQINTIKYGVRSSNPRLLQNLEATAYHEAGHAIVSLAVNPDVLVEQVTVMPREGTLGFVSYNIESAQYRQMNRKELLDDMCVALAGRMAQTRAFPEYGDDGGAGSDLQKATAIAVYGITKLGLDEKVGNVVLSFDDKLPPLASGGMVFKRAQAWLKKAEQLCGEVLEQHWEKVDALARRLIEDEVVTGETLRNEFSV